MIPVMLIHSFTSIPLVCGSQCWNLFCFKRTGLDVTYLMQRRAQGPTTLNRMITDCGAPTKLKSDNAPEFKSKTWTSIIDKMSIKPGFTEAHHPNENLAERRGGAIKAATVHLLRVTGCPLGFWCYAIEYVCLLRTVLARRSLNWSTPHELHWGERPDISMFRFIFWEPIWYYNPRQAFPKPKMLKGRFLGIAQNIGDAFCFLILTQPEDGDTTSSQVIARSVVRRRFAREEAPVVESGNTPASLVIYKSDGITPLEDWTPSSELDDQIDDIIDAAELLRGGNDKHQQESHDVIGMTEEDAFESGMVEVYGPSAKRPRLEHQPSSAIAPATSVISPQQVDDAVPEEQPVDNFTSDTPSPQPPTVLESTETLRDNLCVADAEGPLCLNAALSKADSTNDDSKNDLDVDPMPGDDFNVVTQDQDIEPEMLEEITHQLNRVAEDSTEDGLFDSIEGHDWEKGILKFRIKWKTGETSMAQFSVAKRDYPRETADYVLRHKLGSSSGQYSGGRYTRWARKFNRNFSRILRRLIRDSNGPWTNNATRAPGSLNVATNLPDGARLIRRVVRQTKTGGSRKRKKPGRLSRPVQEKYGVVIPRSVKHALQLDEESGTTFWMDAIKKEIDSLLALNCFEFHSPDYKPSSGYQWTKLIMNFEVKQDGRRKARLVAGGHLVDPMGINSRSTVVKGISVRLLDLIAHRDNLPVLCGDIGNAFITAECMEKIYTHAGPEFGEREGSVLIFKKALYGLRSSSRAFRTHFADFLRSLGFSATRYDRDVWMRKREEEDGYDYICTHVDDFKIVARDPERWKAHISGAFMLKSIGPPSYYLGNDYNDSEEERAWVVSCATYLKECVRRIESDPDLEGELWTQRTPLPEGCHPELDDSNLLLELGIRKYQMLIGMAQWAVTIGRLDIAFAVSSLSRFSAAPREHHLELACYLFGYVKKHPNRRIVVDSRLLLVDDDLRTTSFHPDFLEDYPDANEDVAMDFPIPFGRELDTSVFFDADHAHDHVTRRSISGLIVFVGSIPVLWQSKRQGCIATNTYCAEFISMRSAVEEAISIRYMLRCLLISMVTILVLSRARRYQRVLS